MKKRFFVIGITTILLILFFTGCFEDNKKTSSKINIELINIQQLIDNASTGDIINIPANTYFENIVINKPITLNGENKETTIIDGSREIAIIVNVENVVINGFTIKNCTNGIIINSNLIDIKENNFYDNNIGINLRNVTNCSISNNYFSNHTGIVVFLEKCSYNNIFYNTLIKNTWGIYLSNYQEDIPHTNSRNNNISYNTLKNNNPTGIAIEYSDFNIISNNLIENSYLSGLTIFASNKNLVFKNKIILNKNYGIKLDLSSNNNSIRENDINNGFYCLYSIDYIISGKYNTNNTIYNNNFITDKNTTNAKSKNFWDNGTSGNYWSDYTDKYPNAIEINGIWDTPYIINNNNQDNFPLINPVEI